MQQTVTTLLIGHDISSHPSDHRRWSLEIFRLSSERRQQRVLQAFANVDIPGAHVLGETREDEWLVIADSATITDEIRSRRIIMRIDPSAVRTVSINPRHHMTDELDVAMTP